MLAKSCKLQLQRRKTKTENENNSFFSSVALPLAELVREADGGHQLSGCQTHTQSTERERERGVARGENTAGLGLREWHACCLVS